MRKVDRVGRGWTKLDLPATTKDNLGSENRPPSWTEAFHHDSMNLPTSKEIHMDDDMFDVCQEFYSESQDDDAELRDLCALINARLDYLAATGDYS
jgi:hypothetical protein